MGNWETHRDTGRQRSEPEDGKHARQPERAGGEKSGPAEGTTRGGWLPGPKPRGLTWPAGVLSSGNRRITPNQRGAGVDRNAGGSETWVQITTMFAERYHDAGRDYREPEKYELCQSRASVDGTAK
jgi:hypothetical protein